MKILQIALLAALAAFFMSTASAQSPEIIKQHRMMLYPVVLVAGARGTGSGTVIFSAKRDGGVETYVLTNHHVIASAITVKEEWDPKEAEKKLKETRVPVKVSWFDYNSLSREVGTRGQTADIVAYDQALDLALLKTRDREKIIDHVAALLPEDSDLFVFQRSWAVGAGLGKPPFPTMGALSNLDQRIEGRRYLLSSAPIIFGNSGGALFHFSDERDRYELIGVPSAISAAGWSAVTHMAWSIPLETVRDFLREQDLGFVIGDPEEEPEEDDEDSESDE